MGLVPYLFYAAPAAIPTALLWWGQRKAKAHRKTDKPLLTEIHEQTVNDHKEKSNLREDIDEIREIVRDGFRSVSRDIGGLREELRTERLERIAGDARGH